MKTTTILDMLADFVTDALNDDKHTPEEIVDAIRGSVSEWVEYHRVQGQKAEKVLELLQGYKPINFDDIITGERIDIDSIKTDHISFGTNYPVEYSYNPTNDSLFV